MAVKYKVWANTLRPNIVNTYYEALVLRQMVLATSGEGCDIETYEETNDSSTC